MDSGDTITEGFERKPQLSLSVLTFSNSSWRFRRLIYGSFEALKHCCFKCVLRLEVSPALIGGREEGHRSNEEQARPLLPT